MKNLDKYLSLLTDGVDGLLLTSRYSRHYGAQFDIAEGAAIVTKKGCRYFTDARYIESAQANIQGFEVLLIDRDHSYFSRLNDAIADFGVTKLGYEEHYLTVEEYRDYEAVSRAINTARTWRDGASVLAVVSAHTWGKRLRFDEIGRAMYMSTASAKRLHQRFVYEVARELGYKS